MKRRLFILSVAFTFAVGMASAQEDLNSATEEVIQEAQEFLQLEDATIEEDAKVLEAAGINVAEAEDNIDKAQADLMEMLSSGKMPLIVLDGEVVSDPSVLMGLNEEQIKGMEVHKDGAVCDQYGEQGANGVILITTH